ncbi:hypothetical protein GGS23DRAFT_616638 [Durotheca rogersii]|uniref:uncharacterized protein n=1 Tax=Durotheca rogersii TaxID=419775 RepID=UPI00221E516F|nr:uncharacterized protein GGS23DRAFT_616638 [Durotheca rogersii]KAI5857464.1 hypothetical protein GGS23DRAFT_616638 [Durotheca rogersii]
MDNVLAIPPTIVSFREEKYFPSFSDLPVESNLDANFYTSVDGSFWFPAKHWCFLAEIVDSVRLVRLRVYVRDRAGRTIQIAFHTEDRGETVPPPLVQRGNTVAIFYAQQHAFMDSSLGIRQEELSNIKIFPYKHEDILQLSDRVQAYSGTQDGMRVCHGCDAKRETALRCVSCGYFWYCNQDCQATSWQEKGHKRDCEMLRDPDLRMMFQIQWDGHDGHRIFPPM